MMDGPDFLVDSHFWILRGGKLLFRMSLSLRETGAKILH